MNLVTSSLAFLSVALAATSAPAQPVPTERERELAELIRARASALAVARVQGLDSIEVNGQLLPTEAVLREAIFLIGAKQIDAKIADFFIEEQIRQAIENGRDPEDFEISDEELTKDVETLLAEFQRKNPGIDLWEAVRVNYGMDRERYLHTRRQTILFDRVFFPGPATEWPLITREAIKASSPSGGDSFWGNLEKASIGPDGEPRELPAFWLQMCRGWVQKQLKSWSDIRYPSDGLPAELCLAVDARSWRTADAFDVVRHGLYLQDIERALTEVVVREALRQELKDAGAYLSDEEFRAEFEAYCAQFTEPFTAEVIAVSFKGYPSLEAFRQRWRLLRSYERMIASEIDDESLAAHAEEFKGFFGNGNVLVDVIQFLARDLQTAAWLPNGHAQAKQRAEEAMAAIRDGASFDEVLTQRGEYYTNDEERGRLDSKSLNQLRQQLRENEFSDLLNGFSVAHFLFFDAEPGPIYGPMRGPEGWFIARVRARVPARGAISVQDERTRELVRQDYVSHRFRGWAGEVIARAEMH